MDANLINKSKLIYKIKFYIFMFLIIYLKSLMWNLIKLNTRLHLLKIEKVNMIVSENK